MDQETAEAGKTIVNRSLAEIAKEDYGLSMAPINEVENVICDEVTAADMTDNFIEMTRKMLRLIADIGASGLAAPQIGVKKRVFVYWDKRDNNPRVCYNPKYYKDTYTTQYIEKCLTYGPLNFLVKRYKAIQAVWYEWNPTAQEFTKRTKKLSGREAEIFQHETDHLDGKTVATIGKLLDA